MPRERKKNKKVPDMKSFRAGIKTTTTVFAPRGKLCIKTLSLEIELGHGGKRTSAK